MTAALGGGYKYESQETRALGGITPESYDYRDQGKLLAKLTGDVSYLAAYSRKMQKGIDAANQNFVQQIQGFINDIFVLIGGGGDTGLDFGDLKYLLQAVGALLGFDDVAGIPLPVNLFSAAWHFFSTYIFPVDNFKEVIDQLIDAAIATILDLFGQLPIVGQALQQLGVILATLRDDAGPIIALFQSLFALIVDADPTSPGDFIRAIIAVIRSLPQYVQDIVEAIIDFLTSAPEQLAGLIDAIVQGILDIPGVIDDVINALIDMIAQFPEIIGELISAIIELIVTSPELILSLATAVLNLILDLPNLVTRIINAIFGRSDPLDGGTSSGNFISNFLNSSFGWVTGFFNGITKSNRTDQVSVEEASAAAASLMESAIASAKAIAQAGDDGAGGGILGGDDFNRVGEINPPEWDNTYSASILTAGKYILDGQEAKYVYGTSDTQSQIAKFRRANAVDQHTSGDTQNISAIVGTFYGDGNQFVSQSSVNRLYCRMNDSMVDYVFIEWRSDTGGNCRFGYAIGLVEIMVGSAVDATFIGSATNVSLRAGIDGIPRKFGFYKNDILKHSWDDTATALSAMNGTHRGWGWGGRCVGVSPRGRKPWSPTAITISEVA